MKQPLPTFHNVCFMVQKEETRRTIMKESSNDKGMKQYTLKKVVFLAHHEDSKDKQPSSLLLVKNKLFYNKEKTPIICSYSKKT